MKLKTKSVVLKDGTRVVINVSDFNPALHSEPSKKPPTFPKRKTGRG